MPPVEAMFASPGNAPEFSVTEISQALKRTVEDAYGRVRVRGEISGYRGPHASGHMYFCLKDAGAKLDGVVWKTARGIGVRPEEGMEVIATGKLTTYPGKSTYQLVIDRLEPAGVGALLAQLERRKAMLAGEGLFDTARKRALPYLPETIGVITSPTGAVIRDILHRLAERFPRRVLVWPVAVQGEVAAAQVAAAIAGFNTAPPTLRPDLLIVARGGGSVEDLWAFNEEAVVRAVAASAIPTISAVGHETDTSLCDLAADRRAPTPTAAAEMAVPVRADLLATVASLDARQRACATRHLHRATERTQATACRLPSERDLTGIASQRVDDLGERLAPGLAACARAAALRLDRTARALVPALLFRRATASSRDLSDQTARLTPALTRATDRHRARLERAALPPALIARRAATAARDLHDHSHRLSAAGLARLAAARLQASRSADPLRPALVATSARIARARLVSASRLLRTLSFTATLERGYAVVERESGGVLGSAAAARTTRAVRLRFHDGPVLADVRRATPVRPAPVQDSLL